MKKILVITLLIFISSTVLNAETIKPKKTPLKKLSKQLGNGELIKINSYQTSDYKGILEGWYKESPIIVDALITYPEGEGPFPLLLIVHSSGGADEFTANWLEFMRDQQKPLLDMGIATMYLDNFSARGAKHTYTDQSKASIWSTYIDVFMALEYLSKDPKINIKKVGVSGYSRGGNLSIMAAEKRLRDILVSKDLYFAASQPRSAECGITGMFRNPTPVKETKIWYVHGLAEDYTLPGPCVDIMEKMQAKGADIRIDLREGWYHLFTGNYEPEIEKRTQYFWKCPNFYTEDDGNPNKEFFDLILKNTKIKSLDEFNELSRKNPRKAFKTMFKGLKKENCIGKGVTEGGNHGKTFMPEYLAFWKENLLN